MSDNIFKDLYKKVIDFFSITESENKSKDVARNRLKLVLMQDRTNLNPRLLAQLREEMIELLSKYVIMDKEQLELNFTPDENEDQLALMLSIPVIRAKSEEEIEETLRKEREEKERIKRLEEEAEKIKKEENDELISDSDEEDDEEEIEFEDTDEESEDSEDDESSDETEDGDIDESKEETNSEVDKTRDDENTSNENTENVKNSQKKHKKHKKHHQTEVFDADKQENKLEDKEIDDNKDTKENNEINTNITDEDGIQNEE